MENANCSTSSSRSPFHFPEELTHDPNDDRRDPSAPLVKKGMLQFSGYSKGNPGPAGAGAILFNDQDGEFYEIERYREGVGNQRKVASEFRGLLLGLRKARKHGFNELIIQGSSVFVLNQFIDVGRIETPTVMQIYDETVQSLDEEAILLKDSFPSVSFEHISEEECLDAYEEAFQALTLEDGQVEHGGLLEMKRYVVQFAATSASRYHAAPGAPAGAAALIFLKEAEEESSEFFSVMEGIGVYSDEITHYRSVVLALQKAKDRGCRHITLQGTVDSFSIIYKVSDALQVPHPNCLYDAVSPFYREVSNLVTSFDIMVYSLIDKDDKRVRKVYEHALKATTLNDGQIVEGMDAFDRL